MFEIPEAKRVRREDLYDSGVSNEGGSGDESDNAELQALLDAQVASALGLDDRPNGPRDVFAEHETVMKESQDAAMADNGRDEDHSATPDNAFEFRLFSTAGPTPKVILEDDRELEGKGGLARPRPASYYLVTDISTKQKRQYEYAAVSGDEVLRRSKCTSQGLELPWKVTTIKVTRKARPGDATTDKTAVEESNTRKRPGKKRRIALRTKGRAQKEKAEAEAKQKVDKEGQLRDKKKRLNRIKRLRRRAKDKESKQGAKGGGADGDAGEGEGESDDDSAAGPAE